MNADTKHRLPGASKAPADPGETRRIERWLATARVFLAVSALVAIRMDPTQLGQFPGGLWAARALPHPWRPGADAAAAEKESTAAFRILVHAADIVWPALISVFGDGPRSPFFLFFVFVLAASAYRWGLWETLGTAAAEVVLLWVESFVLLHVWATRGGSLPGHVFSGLQINVTAFEPKQLFMLSVYLLVMGLLLGYLAEQQKHLRGEKAAVTRILAKVRVEAGLTGTLQQICSEILNTCGAERVLVASQEIHSHRMFLGELHNGDGKSSEFVWQDSSPRDAKNYSGGFSGRSLLRAARRRALVRNRTRPRGQPRAITFQRAAYSTERAAILPVGDCAFLRLRGRVAGAGVWYSTLRGKWRYGKSCVFCSICSARRGQPCTTSTCSTG